jgi:O-antigen/teichoic acid export membrane protein
VRTRTVIQNSGFALAGDLAAKAGAMAVMMVVARSLPTAGFAVLATAIAAATVLTSALDLGSQTLLARDGVAGPAARGGLLRALAIARAPLLAVALLVAAVLGAVTGRAIEPLAAVALAATGAVQLSLTGALRSAQDLRPEAGAKLAGGLLTLAFSGACLLIAPSAGAVLIALAAGNLLALVPLVPALRAAVGRAGIVAGGRMSARTALVRAAPLGAMALATLAYYRSGTIALALVSSSTETARFAAASTVAFGLLSVGNAVTTGLLPRLAGAEDDRDRAAVTRRALWWTTLIATLLAGAVALAARPLLALVFGSRYAPASGSLAMLAGATALIAPAGVLGTALVAAGRLRPVGIQVGISLAVNVLALVALAPGSGAIGAAGATLACEAVALGLLARAAVRELPHLAAGDVRGSSGSPVLAPGTTP